MALLNEAKQNREHKLYTQPLWILNVDGTRNSWGEGVEMEQELWIHDYKGAQGYGETAELSFILHFGWELWIF